jgi:crotonobetainyl-CoA hydratase
MSSAESGESYKYCSVEDSDRIRIVTLNRPEVMNALNTEANHELNRVWDDFASRSDLWVGIVTGAGGRAFSAGNDLKMQAAGRRGQQPHSGFAGLVKRFDLNKPLIAAVNGVAMGGGCELALACDIVIASANAVFALPEVRVGLVASGGGMHRLPRMIPHKHAMGMILTGRRVSAEEARQLGFVNEVVPEGQALAGARRWADLILECSPMALRASKEAVNLGLDEESLEKAVRTIYPAQAANLQSEDYIEGPRAFDEKRRPDWKNR